MLHKYSILRRCRAGASLPACRNHTPANEDKTLVRFVRKISLFCTITLLLSLSTIASGQIISNVTIGGSTISPDGDGIQDSTYIAVTFSDSILSFDAFVLTGDTLSIVDILVEGDARSSGTDSTWWNGENFFGIVVPEGHYLFFVRAQAASGTDSAYMEISVDLSPPQVSIVRIEPSTLIAPGLPDQQPLRIDYIITDTFPTDAVYVNALVVNPSASEDTLTSQLLEINKTYRAEWDGSSAAVDGMYEVQIRARDNGGHVDVASASINVDLDEPTIQITSPDNDKEFIVIPDSIHGWMYDRNAVMPVQIAYSEDKIYTPVPNQWVMDDTLFFNAPLADSITAEGNHQLWFKASDSAGRIKSIRFNIELDTHSPAPPKLDPPPDVVYTPKYLLTGSFSSDTKKIRIFRNDSYVDSVFILLQTSLSEEIIIKPGTNVITAVAVDEAGNTSLPSNAITVVYDTAPTVFIPQPFRSNDSFQINLSGKEAVISLNIYDLGGDLVFTHKDFALGSNLDVPWDGINGKGKDVKRGPLVIVVHIAYNEGNDDTLREIFLFNP
jgi:hypothetical protein